MKIESKWISRDAPIAIPVSYCPHGRRTIRHCRSIMNFRHQGQRQATDWLSNQFCYRQELFDKTTEALAVNTLMSLLSPQWTDEEVTPHQVVYFVHCRDSVVDGNGLLM